jgi:hypothetical protein
MNPERLATIRSHYGGTEPVDELLAEIERLTRERDAFPDMLTALQVFDGAWEKAAPGGPNGPFKDRLGQWTLKTWRLVRAAIAKATSQENNK